MTVGGGGTLDHYCIFFTLLSRWNRGGSKYQDDGREPAASFDA